MTDPTTSILNHFENINAIPRCSKNEAGLCKWLRQWAEQHRLPYDCDKSGNMVVNVPASAGYEKAPTVVLQGHMDMVCEKTPDSTHDFEKDPIVSHREGDWLTATDTTLGADNGIAIAYMLALVEDKSVAHPPLELLFTIDEETGLNGAKLLDPGFVKGRLLINLDSEDEGVFTIGCAGGTDTTLTLKLDRHGLPANGTYHELVIGGLTGGHSGIDIHKHRSNANKIMARTLARLSSEVPIRLVSLSGGSRKNAIPRDSKAVIWSAEDTAPKLQPLVTAMAQTVLQEFHASDNELFIRIDPIAEETHPEKALSREDTDHIIWTLLAFPNGVVYMSPEIEGAVETSCNLATVRLSDDQLTILTSQRSASVSRIEEITQTVHAVGKLIRATCQDQDEYPPWQPRVDSVLLEKSKKAYRKRFDREPIIQVIHAGLECAVIGDIYPGMDMISFGPTIRNPHSPDERILIPSVEKVWDFLVTLLEEIKN